MVKRINVMYMRLMIEIDVYTEPPHMNHTTVSSQRHRCLFLAPFASWSVLDSLSAAICALLIWGLENLCRNAGPSKSDLRHDPHWPKWSRRKQRSRGSEQRCRDLDFLWKRTFVKGWTLLIKSIACQQNPRNYLAAYSCSTARVGKSDHLGGKKGQWIKKLLYFLWLKPGEKDLGHFELRGRWIFPTSLINTLSKKFRFFGETPWSQGEEWPLGTRRCCLWGWKQVVEVLEKWIFSWATEARSSRGCKPVEVVKWNLRNWDIKKFRKFTASNFNFNFRQLEVSKRLQWNWAAAVAAFGLGRSLSGELDGARHSAAAEISEATPGAHGAKKMMAQIAQIVQWRTLQPGEF